MSLEVTTYRPPLEKYHGSLSFADGSIILASGLAVANGTISSGDVTSTQVIDGTYLVVNESGQFDIQFTFTGLTNHPSLVNFVGRYEGNVAHNVKIYCWNYNTTTWDAFTADAQDFTSTTSDEELVFNYPSGNENYVSGGEAKVKIEHLSAAVGTHNMYIDFISVYQETVSLPSANAPVKLTGLTEGQSNLITLDGTNGTCTILVTANYDIDVFMSFVSSSGTDIVGALYVNGVKNTKIKFIRTITSSTAFASASSGDTIYLTTGDVLDFRVSSDLGTNYITIANFTFRVELK